MIFTVELVLNGIGNEITADKNKPFLKYKPPKMENIQCEIPLHVWPQANFPIVGD